MLEVLRHGACAQEQLTGDVCVRQSARRKGEGLSLADAESELVQPLGRDAETLLVDEQQRRIALDAANDQLCVFSLIDAWIRYLLAEPPFEERRALSDASGWRERQDMPPLEPALER